MATANTYQLTGKASVTFRTEKHGTKIVRYRDRISEAEYKALPRRQQAFFKQTKPTAATPAE